MLLLLPFQKVMSYFSAVMILPSIEISPLLFLKLKMKKYRILQLPHLICAFKKNVPWQRLEWFGGTGQCNGQCHPLFLCCPFYDEIGKNTDSDKLKGSGAEWLNCFLEDVVLQDLLAVDLILLPQCLLNSEICLYD